jgi:opacity protein-like surface antigen
VVSRRLCVSVTAGTVRAAGLLASALVICGIADLDRAYAQQSGGGLLQGAGKAVMESGRKVGKIYAYPQLKALWDKVADAEAAYGVAQLCGNPQEVASTKAAAEEANKALDKAIDDYNRQYSDAVRNAGSDYAHAMDRADHDPHYVTPGVGGNRFVDPPYVKEAEKRWKDTVNQERNRVRDLLAQGKPISYFRAADECHQYYAAWGGPHAGGGIGVQNTIGNDWVTSEIISLDHDDFVPANGGNFTTGFRASTYVGYDWMVTPRWLAGIEGDVGYSTNNRTAGIPGVSSAPGDSLSMREDWDGSLRARFGYLATPQVLLYGTTGPAWQRFSATVTCTSATPFPCGRFGPVAPMTATYAAAPTGWTIGGGLEYALTGRLKLRAEYRYSDYGTVSATFGTPANLAIDSNIHMQTQTATLGLSYAFGGR